MSAKTKGNMMHILLGKFVRLDDQEEYGKCTISRIDHVLSDQFFLARRIISDGRETSEHVVSLSMLAVQDGAELFETYAAVLESIGAEPGEKEADDVRLN